MNSILFILRSLRPLNSEEPKQWNISSALFYGFLLSDFIAVAKSFSLARSSRALEFKATILTTGFLGFEAGWIFRKVRVSTAQGIEQNPARFCLSKSAASETFWKLGDCFWMQIIDGKYHQYGPMVFDEGLHKGKKEPGFFASLKEGCQFASEHLTEKTSLIFYKSLHKKLCSHFRARDTNTVMKAEEAGLFRTKSCQCRPSIHSKVFNAEAAVHAKNVQLYDMRDQLKEAAEDDFSNTYQRIVQNYPASKEWLDNWNDLWEKKVKEVDRYVTQICQELGVKKLVQIWKQDHLLYTDYLYDNPDEIEVVVKFLFERYEKQIKKIVSAPCDRRSMIKSKIEAIADLYQLLEWLHPFPDGQGRTDLVLMAKHLSEEGLSPAILEEPYVSTYSTLSEWKEYLLKGMRAWTREKLSIEVIPDSITYEGCY